MMRLPLIVFALWFAAIAHAEGVTFGVTPQHAAGELARLWVPICHYLSKRSGTQVQFKTAKDLSTFWEDSGKGAFDLIYINPYYYTKARASAGYAVFAKDGGAPLVGIVFVRKDGPRRIDELNGGKLAVPDLSAFVTRYFIQTHLHAMGVHMDPVSVNSNESVYRVVEKGLYPAGTSIQRIFGMLEPETQAQFRIVWKSDPLPPFAYAAHPRVSPKVLASIRQALLEMDDNPEGRALLSALNIRAIQSAKDSDYDSVRKMKLE